MSQQGPLPWLDVSGAEIANAGRVLQYLRRGLGTGHFDVQNGSDVCSVLYRNPDGSVNTFISPATDPAPWYDPTEPGSTSFLGVVLLDINGYDSTIARAVTPKIVSLGGGSLARQRRLPRVWKFRAALISADDAGAEFGLRWLTAALQTAECTACATGTLSVRLVCPPTNGSNDALGLWTSYGVALTDGPHEVSKWAPRSQQFDTDFLAGCRDLIAVEWEMQASNPLLYKTPILVGGFQIAQAADCLDICSFLFGTPGDASCVTVAPPRRGTTGTLVSLTSVNGFGGLLVESYAICPTANIARLTVKGPSPRAIRPPVMRYRRRRRLLPTTVLESVSVHTHERRRQQTQSFLRPPAVVLEGGSPTKQIALSGVPAGTTVAIDSSRRGITVTTTDPATGQPIVSDGTYLVDLSENTAIEWLEVRDCDPPACICVRAASPCSSGDVNVLIWTQAREG